MKGVSAKMIEELSAIFTGLSSGTETARAIKELLKGKKGDTRALIEELKGNLTLCWLVVERGTDPAKVIPELAISDYDRILKAGFNFNALQKKKIRRSRQLEASDLAFLIGKETDYLLINIYDKIKELRLIYKVDRKNPRIRWRMRIINLHRRMLLLVKHLQS